MLDIFTMLLNQGLGQSKELGAELGDKLGSDQILDGLLFFRIGVDVNVELDCQISMMAGFCSTVTSASHILRTHLPRCHVLLLAR
jgi:hypothetical protein